MKYLITCLLCTVNLWIIIDNEGKCIEIRTNDNTFPCTKEIMIDTGCWDNDGNSELCNASWEQISIDK